MDDDRIWDHNAPGNDNTENTALYRNRENFASPYAHYQFQQRTSAIQEESSPKHRKKKILYGRNFRGRSRWRQCLALWPVLLFSA